MSKYSIEVLPSEVAISKLPHNRYDKAQCVVFEGRRGNGKTWALTRYCETREPRIFCLDPFSDFVGMKVSPDLESGLDDMERYPTACRRRVRPPFNTDSKEYANAFFEMAINGLRNCLIVMDEMSLWSGMKANPALLTLIMQGRRLGLRTAIACQRISLIPGDILSESTELVIFNTVRPRDLDVLEDWSNSTTPDIARNLTVGECLLIRL